MHENHKPDKAGPDLDTRHLPVDLEPGDPDKLSADAAVVEEGFWRKVRTTLGHVPFMEDAIAAWYCARDDRTPGYVRAIILAALAYFVVPTDAIPDILAGLGFTDDASVITAALAAVGSHVTLRHRNLARAFLEKPALPPDTAD